jgi:enterobactin synthetase component D
VTAGFARTLAHGHAVALAIEPAAAEANLDAERVAAARYRGGRADEYLAGRRALRAAVAALGLDVAVGAIDADERGAPRLPDGVVGSISHKATLALALAAPAAGWTVGVDLERRAPRPTDIARKVLTVDELAGVAALDDDARRRAVVRAFAIKEAVYKAIDPYLRRYVGFLEVALRDHADADGERVAVIAPDAWGLDIEAACVAHGEHWIATARARRR